MKTAIVIGAGIGGLSAALALQQRGYTPLIIDQDDAPPSTLDHPNDWPRRGAPQVRHPHFFMGRLRRLLKARHPKLVEAMLAAGAWEMSFASTVPPAVRASYKPLAGDAELTALVARRTTFELVLRQYVKDVGIECRCNTKVTSLLFAPAMGEAIVRGVRMLDARGDPAERATRQLNLSDLGSGLLVDGTTEALFADVVIDASGRRSTLAAQARTAGADIREEQHDAGLIYFTRHYRLLTGAARPDSCGLVAVEFADFTVGALPADNDHFTVTIAPWSDDELMKRSLRNVDVFHKIAMEVPPIAEWVNPARAEPVSEVYAFGAMDCFWRSTVLDGAPQVLGLYFVGDTAVRTNPKYGRGCTWSCEQAHALADLLGENLTPEQTAVRYDAWLTQRFRRDWETTLQLDRGARQKYERFRTSRAGRAASTLMSKALPVLSGGISNGGSSNGESSNGASSVNKSLSERAKGWLLDRFEDYGMKTAVQVDPVVQRAIMTGYHGLVDMDAWTRRPIIWARILWTWLTYSRWRAHMRPYRTRPVRPVLAE